MWSRTHENNIKTESVYSTVDGEGASLTLFHSQQILRIFLLCFGKYNFLFSVLNPDDYSFDKCSPNICYFSYAYDERPKRIKSKIYYSHIGTKLISVTVCIFH